MKRRKSSVGEFISTLVFFVMAIWLTYEGIAGYSRGEIIKAMLIWLGGFLALIASFRFQIQIIVNKLKKQNEN